MTHCFEGVVNFVTDELDDGVTFIPIQYSDIIRDICEGLINTLLRFTEFKQLWCYHFINILNIYSVSLPSKFHVVIIH